MSVLTLNLHESEEFQSLEQLIKCTIGEIIQRENNINYQREFDPKKGVVINQEQAALCQASSAKKVSEYVESCRLKSLPPLLALRFYGVADDSPVKWPEDGIIDLSIYSDASEGEIQARYKIKSYILLLGSSQSGHYVSHVEINGKYYNCDDLTPNYYKEITQEEFLNTNFQYNDPCLFILERISESKEE